jgi:hypothetical protein
MPMTEDQRKHLDMLQAVITRLAGNSFILKGWSATLVTGLFALSAKETNAWYLAVALLPAVTFWLLDTYYLRQERLFRRLFEDSVTAYGGGTTATYSFNTSAPSVPVASFRQVFWSPTIRGFHLPLLLVVVLVFVLASVLQLAGKDKKNEPQKKDAPTAIACMAQK